MSSFSRAIIVDGRQLSAYDTEALHPYVLALFRRSELKTHVLRSANKVNRALACFAEITGTDLSSGSTCLKRLGLLLPTFIGALYSSTFLDAPPSRRYQWAVTAQAALRHLISVEIPLSIKGPSHYVNELTIRFEALELIPDKVWYWTGWAVKNHLGTLIWLPFHALAKTLDRSYVSELHIVLAQLMAGLRGTALPGLKEFSSLIASTPGITSANLRSPGYMRLFWHKLWEYYKLERTSRDSPSTLLANWSNQWAGIVRNTLIPAKLLAPLIEEDLPGPNSLEKLSAAGNGADEGSEPTANLLLDIPLSATDSEAWNLLLVAVPESLSTVRTWANHTADNLINRCQTSKKRGLNGIPLRAESRFNTNESKWLRARDNSEHLANAAATFAERGFQLGDSKSYYPTPTSYVCIELGLPIAYSLVAHAALIALHDAKITTAFLDEIVLFDKHGKLVGLSKQGNLTYLIGAKPRKGSATGQQSIELDNATLRRVEEVIEITAPCRAYLKQVGNDSWRKLFLECGSNFTQPKPVKFTKAISNSKRNGCFSDSLNRTPGLSELQKLQLLRNFSLKSVRSTLSVLKFIETHSEFEASQVLGHQELDYDLLARYLPTPLVNFYRNRWVHAFQNNLLVLCIDDEANRLRATGITSAEELQKFLNSHSYAHFSQILLSADLDSRPETKSTNVSAQINNGKGTFVFNANAENILSIYAVHKGIHKFKEKGDQIYWSTFCNYLIVNFEQRARYDTNLANLIRASSEILHR